MEIDPDHLPAGMHIVAAVNARKGGQTPFHHDRTSTLLLSSTGGLYLYHPNQLSKATIKSGDVSDMRSFIDTPRQVNMPKRLIVWKVSVAYSLALISLWWIVMIFLILDQALNGYIPLSSTSSDGSASSNDVAEGVTLAIANLVWLSLPFAPYFYCLFRAHSIPKYVSPRTLELKFDDTKLTICDAPEWSRAFPIIEKGWKWGIILFLATMIPSSDLIIALTQSAVFLFLMYLFFAGFLFLTRDDSTEIGELNTGNLNRFARILGDLHHQHHKDKGEDNEDDQQIAVGTVRDRVGHHIQKPLEKLYSYKQDLNELTNGEWEAMLTTEKFYFSLAQIRRCTEKMLHELTTLHGIRIKSKNRGLTTMLQRLVQHDHLPADAIKWIEIIKAIANPAAHDMTENADDFISAFNAFVSFTSWYVEASRSDQVEEE